MPVKVKEIPEKHTTIFGALRKEKRMRVRMLKNLDIALDGRNVEGLKRGESYNLPESCVSNLLDKKIAQEDKALDPPGETKVKKTTRRKPKK